jgi:hypothetical protein
LNALLLEMIEGVLSDQNGEELPEDSRSLYIYDTIESFINSTRTPLLARQGKYWLAYLLGRDRPLFNDILEIGEKKTGFYLFMGTEGGKLLFRHIATGKVLEVTTESMVPPEGLQPGRSISFAGFVNWRDEWWFPGAGFPVRPASVRDKGGAGPIPGMVFFNRGSGIQTAFGFNDLVPDPDNRWYSQEEAGEEAMRLLYSNFISGDWMHYLAENYDIPGLSFPGLGGKELLMENLDFMLRFWKRKGYYP